MQMNIGELREAINDIDDNYSLTVRESLLLLHDSNGVVVEEVDLVADTNKPQGTGGCSVCSCIKFKKKKGTLRLCTCGDQKKEHL